jgi:hypothetical protein
MRYLIGALCAAAILFGAVPSAAAAASVGCGRITTFTAPNSVSSNAGGDGWLIYAKPDGTSDKVIIRSGTVTPDGPIAGYVCLGLDGFYFTGLLAPGTVGYIPEPASWLTGTGVYCGIVAVNPFTSGQISGPNTFRLGGALTAFGQGIFSVPASIASPQVGRYLCGRFAVGAPSQLMTVLVFGDAGYVVAGLPNTSTAGSPPRSVPAVAALGAALLAMFGLRVVGGRTRER